jgi:hypothetical protein
MRGECSGEDAELLHTKKRKYSDSRYENGSPDTKVKHTCNSLTAMYNLRANLDCGLGQVALHCILCTCTKCIKQTNKKPWAQKVELNIQPLYASSTEYDMRPIFHGLNDWCIIELKPASNGEHEEYLHVAQNIVLLGSLGRIIMGEVQEGNIAAFSTEDPESDGFYVVRFRSDPYALIQQMPFATESNPPNVVEEGALVVDAEYFNIMQKCNCNRLCIEISLY